MRRDLSHCGVFNWYGRVEPRSNCEYQKKKKKNPRIVHYKPTENYRYDISKRVHFNKFTFRWLSNIYR